MLRARCVLCASGDPRCSAILWRLRVLCGWGGLCACPGCGALVALPSRRDPPPPFGLCAVALWAGRAALPTALRSGPVLQQCCCWCCCSAAIGHWSLPPPRYQSRDYGGAAPRSSSVAAEPWLVATAVLPPRSLFGSLQPAPAPLPIKGLLG